MTLQQEKEHLLAKWNAEEATVEEAARLNELLYGHDPVTAREIADISLGLSNGDVVTSSQ